MAPDVPATSARTDLPREAGGFRLLRQLGRGGMGVVYLAEELSSGRQVALKVLLSDLSVSGEAFERFRREARLAAAISDSHCVFVFGAHEVEGAPAIAMELCGGQTLDQRIARGERIPTETAVQWMLEILEGLEAAHATGVIHRDVKPSNCFTTEDGHVKVGDFGLSRSLESDVQLTQSGAFLGSPLYAAPEQIKGREVDVRSDLYSCGATLYALLAGKPPYTGSNLGEVLARILSEPPTPPREIRSDIPVGLEKVVLRAMERDPKKRFQDHASFREALQPFAGKADEPARFFRRFVAYLLDTAVLASVSAALMFFFQTRGYEFAAMNPTHPWLMKSPWFGLSLQCVGLTYFVVLEGLLGAGVGKWILGQRVVGVASGQPSFARTALRTLAFSLPGMVVGVACNTPNLLQWQHGVLTTLLPTACHLAFFLTARRTNGYRALHDFASGTRVTQTASPFVHVKRTVPPPRREPERRADLPARIGPYEIEGSMGRTPFGEMLQGRDPELLRDVWIHVSRGETPALAAARRALARPGRLRWLGQSTVDGTHHEVYEAPGGTSLRAWCTSDRRMSWPMAQRYLTGLAEELSTDESEARTAVFSPAQVWLDRGWNARILDVPLDDDETGNLDSVALFTESARAVLAAPGAQDERIPPDLPEHAEPVVRRLVHGEPPFASVRDAHRELVKLTGRTAALSANTRAAQLLLSVAFPTAFAALMFIVAIWVVPAITQFAEARAAILFLDPKAEDEAEGPGARDEVQLTPFGKLRVDTTPADPAAPPLTREEEDAAYVLITNGLAAPFGPAFLRQLPERARLQYDAALARHPSTSDEEVIAARGTLASRFDDDDGPNVEDVRALRYRMPAWSIASLVILWGVVATACAFFARGGLTMRLCGICVRSRKGPLASRWRCVWRVLLAWVPLAAAYFAATVAIQDGSIGLGLALFAATALVHAAALAHAIWSPSRGIVDRVAGTTLVPR